MIKAWSLDYVPIFGLIGLSLQTNHPRVNLESTRGRLIQADQGEIIWCGPKFDWGVLTSRTGDIRYRRSRVRCNRTKRGRCEITLEEFYNTYWHTHGTRTIGKPSLLPVFIWGIIVLYGNACLLPSLPVFCQFWLTCSKPRADTALVRLLFDLARPGIHSWIKKTQPSTIKVSMALLWECFSFSWCIG